MVLEDLQKWQDKLHAGVVLGQKCYSDYGEKLPEHPKEIVFFGMGGSGIAGNVLKTLLLRQGEIRSEVCHSPEVPQGLTRSTLAFVMSYSGNTWETVVALKKLVASGVPTVVVTHGGRAEEIAIEEGLICVKMPEAVSPRGGLGYFLGFFFALFEKMHLFEGMSKIDAYIKHCDTYISQYSEKSYFDDFVQIVGGRDVLLVWGVAGDSGAFAYRAQTQFNENSKIQAVYLEFPELCHNFIVGFTKMASKPLVIWYHTHYVSDYLKKAIAATEQLLQESSVGLYKPAILGDTFDVQLFNIILWSDFASYFLGVARDVEVNPVKLIDKLKHKHKEQGILV